MIVSEKEEEYKAKIRKNIKETAFKELKVIQAKHSKVNTIIYEKFEKQAYLVSPLFTNEDVSILSNLRSHTTRGIKDNFHRMYGNDISCPLKCWPEGAPPIRDTQEHIMLCSKLELLNPTVASGTLKYDDIYGNTDQQKEVVTVMKELLKSRNKSLQPTSGCDHWTQAPHGAVKTPVICNVCIGT